MTGSPAELEAERFLTMNTAFKAASLVADLMLEALQTAHPDRAAVLQQSIDLGMHLSVQFVLSKENAKAVLAVVDDYGSVRELACVPCVLVDPETIRKN